MERVVAGFPLEGRADIFTVLMPEGAEILRLAVSDNTLKIYAIVDLAEKKEMVRFKMVPTGFTIPDPGAYVGSATLSVNNVWHEMHFFRIPPPDDELVSIQMQGESIGR